MDIQKILTISTEHVTKETFALLCKDAKTWEVNDFVVTYAKKNTFGLMGFWIMIPEDYREGRTDGLYEDVPNDLHECIVFALDHDCGWLCLDKDGEIIPELDTYEQEKIKIMVTEIDWDTDGEENLSLPDEVCIDDPTEEMLSEVTSPGEYSDAISDYLSDISGYCHKGFKATLVK